MESSDGFQIRIVPHATGLSFRSLRPRPSSRGFALAVSPELRNFGVRWFLRQCQNQNRNTATMELTRPFSGNHLWPMNSKTLCICDLHRRLMILRQFLWSEKIAERCKTPMWMRAAYDRKIWSSEDRAPDHGRKFSQWKHRSCLQCAVPAE